MGFGSGGRRGLIGRVGQSVGGLGGKVEAARGIACCVLRHRRAEPGVGEGMERGGERVQRGQYTTEVVVCED